MFRHKSGLVIFSIHSERMNKVFVLHMCFDPLPMYNEP